MSGKYLSLIKKRKKRGQIMKKAAKVFEVKGATNETKILNFYPPLFLDRGIFIDLGGDTHEVTVLLSDKKS